MELCKEYNRIANTIKASALGRSGTSSRMAITIGGMEIGEITNFSLTDMKVTVPDSNRRIYTEGTFIYSEEALNGTISGTFDIDAASRRLLLGEW
jgi:hypothetical protein